MSDIKIGTRFFELDSTHIGHVPATIRKHQLITSGYYVRVRRVKRTRTYKVYKTKVKG